MLNQDGYTIRGVQQLLAGAATAMSRVVDDPVIKPEKTATSAERCRLRRSLRDALDKG
jgi:hypothetical protein